MKGEYLESKPDCSSMFSKLHHHHQNFPPPPLHHHFQISPHQTSEDDDIAGKSKSLERDGATIEVVRRPRGRPPGSKNKPKPPIVITREHEPSMSPYILELPGGADIVDSVSRFTRRRNLGLCVLTGSGTVVNVTLRQPSNNPGATVTFHGRFDILSLSATFMPPAAASSSPFPIHSSGGSENVTISLAGPQGQIVGGAVAGNLLAAGTVYVVAASFNNPIYHRLPESEDQRNSASGGNDGQSSPGMASGGDSVHAPAAQVEAMSMYSCHLPTSDVIWAPTARQALPPPY